MALCNFPRKKCWVTALTPVSSPERNESREGLPRAEAAGVAETQRLWPPHPIFPGSSLFPRL